MNRDDFIKRSVQLKAEVKAKTAAMEAGDITPAEYTEFITKAHAENESISTTLSNFNTAEALTKSPDVEPVEDRRPRDPDDIQPMQAKALVQRYASLKHAAMEKLPQQAHSFDLALKTVGFGGGLVQTKTQGITGLQGENASGTSAGTTLSGSGSQASSGTSYFLGGPGGYDITPQWVPGILELRWYENIIASLMPSLPVDSPVVSYVRETAWTNNSAGVGEGATMPTSTNTIGRYTEQVGKVANLVRVTDEEIQDSNYFWALVQKRATMGVTRQEEVQLLAGAGYPGVNGLLNRTSAFTTAQTLSAMTNVQIPSQNNPGVGASSVTVSSVTPGRQVSGVSGSGLYPDGLAISEGILAALTDIRINHFFEPTAVVINPLDWFIIRTLKDANNQYMSGSMFGFQYGLRAEENPAIDAVNDGLTLWGKKIAVTPAIPQGLVLVGDFANGTAVLRRGGMRVEIVNTNGTDFEQGMWTMRSYVRTGLAVYRPELFELIHLVNG